MSDDADALDLIAALRAGLVPRRGLERLVTGLDPLMKAVDEELRVVSKGKGRTKWIRGEYGSGKTFATRLLCARARSSGFATSEVQISINDTPLHHLETVYRRLIERLETAADGVGALQAIVEAWLYQLGDEVKQLHGLSEDSPGFADATERRLEDRLAELSKRNSTFAAVLRSYHRAMHEGDYGSAQGLLAWLAGQPQVSTRLLAKSGVQGKVDGQAALTFLAGLLLLLRQSGHDGLVVVLDEVETIQRMNAQSREKSLNALRQMMDMVADEQFPGLYLVITGTRDFFEGYKGLKALQPLHQRVHVAFTEDAQFDNLRAVQVRLQSFSAERLREVGERVRDLYPATSPTLLKDKASDEFVAALVRKVTDGFGGKVTVAPRVFLRELVDVLDRIEQHADYDPRNVYEFRIDEGALTNEELAATGKLAADDEVEGDRTKPRRLDG